MQQPFNRQEHTTGQRLGRQYCGRRRNCEKNNQLIVKMARNKTGEMHYGRQMTTHQIATACPQRNDGPTPSLALLDDRLLMERVGQGDELAYATLMERHLAAGIGLASGPGR